ncbi:MULTISPECIES: adenosylcobinamide-GDP ribazoletransferase [unclassified Polaromonas]|jgi:adenosylcobinamide-GDP ribazoletransferase|uniref:adenosylcobinamide-GDP ribazoletransferase n=1 Tax=unclassified Polaromonas TaxID=2638319 RepID=UPI000BD1373E|nr:MULTISPECIES: adenosylcobinamide-GDP ribazoletransferase [unclassified Polaromonas]OYY35844.1 MAG: adenosylcobinamide-GDP ribazoletransferase [Polaromonas sp. 35-63-35]OYZ19850.1 MAG: adenosylcobinamide-GDP ribazoletransferase [Polaromonas sp. 16-63-31]OYZ79883.1 MAG: adenosylcobinamide-GDP ribazoletransferase [Polaromonas sp. 24-63-21]OZA51999.1 MAG: adenosylcobinamide-GDP ribazoletransferase [Polaromonas sp. 17-63-33]OZA87969.1 MAG: adenosylcobinamide-GDP ribazoletransferase [Polaromonas 
MLQFIRHYLLAVQFFTRIPVTGALAAWTGYSPAMLRASAAHFPGIGWLVGAVAAGVYSLLMALLPPTDFAPLVAAVLSTVATVLLTGGFHEDGLADVTDGLGGSYDRDRALEIMKDSRVGAFGAMALVLALLAKVALVALLGSVESALSGMEEAPDLPLDGWLVAAALFAAHVVSRTLPLLLIRVLPHVGDAAGSKSKPLADQITLASVAVAFVWSFSALALASYALSAMTLIVACSFSVLGLLWMGRLFSRRLQGFTGDCLGATQQVCEIAFYLGLAIAL